ncbi:unnamed protein product, partial [Staurois parvus]
DPGTPVINPSLDLLGLLHLRFYPVLLLADYCAFPSQYPAYCFLLLSTPPLLTFGLFLTTTIDPATICDATLGL